MFDNGTVTVVANEMPILGGPIGSYDLPGGLMVEDFNLGVTSPVPVPLVVSNAVITTSTGTDLNYSTLGQDYTFGSAISQWNSSDSIIADFSADTLQAGGMGRRAFEQRDHRRLLRGRRAAREHDCPQRVSHPGIHRFRIEKRLHHALYSLELARAPRSRWTDLQSPRSTLSCPAISTAMDLSTQRITRFGAQDSAASTPRKTITSGKQTSARRRPASRLWA